MKQRRDWTVIALVTVILIIGSAPLWLWLLDSIVHFGYSGDHG